MGRLAFYCPFSSRMRPMTASQKVAKARALPVPLTLKGQAGGRCGAEKLQIACIELTSFRKVTTRASGAAGALQGWPTRIKMPSHSWTTILLT